MSVLSSSPSVFDRLHDAADLVVGVRGEGGEHFHLAGEELLLVGVSLSQSLMAAGLGASLVSCGDDAELLLAGERLFAVLVPAAVELALVLGDPFLRARGAGRAWRPVAK